MFGSTYYYQVLLIKYSYDKKWYIGRHHFTSHPNNALVFFQQKLVYIDS